MRSQASSALQSTRLRSDATSSAATSAERRQRRNTDPPELGLLQGHAGQVAVLEHDVGPLGAVQGGPRQADTGQAAPGEPQALDRQVDGHAPVDLRALEVDVVVEVVEGGLARRAGQPGLGRGRRHGSAPRRQGAQAQLGQVGGLDRGGGVGERVGARLGLGEGDHLADVLLRQQQGHQPVDAEGEPGVGRRAVAEGVEQEAERSCASSGPMPSSPKMVCCTSERWIRTEPEPSSQPLSTRS